MPQSTEGVLLLIGALFFLIGLLGGGLEISAVKVPPIGQIPRIVTLAAGMVFLALGLFRTMFPPTPAIALQPTNTPTLPAPAITAIPSTQTPVPPTQTSLPPTTAPTIAATRTPTAGSSTNSAASASFRDVTLEHNVTKFGELGMLIHAKFDVAGMNNVKGRLIALFYDDKGQNLLSHDNKDLSADNLFKYQATDGQLIVWDYFTPVYDSATFNDFTLFLPYSAIELPAGDYNLKFRVYVKELKDNQSLATSPDIAFTFSRK